MNTTTEPLQIASVHPEILCPRAMFTPSDDENISTTNREIILNHNILLLLFEGTISTPLPAPAAILRRPGVERAATTLPHLIFLRTKSTMRSSRPKRVRTNPGAPTPASAIVLLWFQSRIVSLPNLPRPNGLKHFTRMTGVSRWQGERDALFFLLFATPLELLSLLAEASVVTLGLHFHLRFPFNNPRCRSLRTSDNHPQTRRSPPT